MRALSAAVGLALLCSACGGADEETSPATTVAVAATSNVSSNKIINSFATDLCTEFTGEECYFLGGQRVIYSDGNVLILGSYRFVYEVAGDTDSNEHSISVLVPTSVSTSYSLLSKFVARGAGYRSLFLVYTRATDTLTLWHDTDNSNTFNSASDTLLHTATLSDWS